MYDIGSVYIGRRQIWSDQVGRPEDPFSNDFPFPLSLSLTASNGFKVLLLCIGSFQPLYPCLDAVHVPYELLYILGANSYTTPNVIMNLVWFSLLLCASSSKTGTYGNDMWEQLWMNRAKRVSRVYYMHYIARTRNKVGMKKIVYYTSPFFHDKCVHNLAGIIRLPGEESRRAKRC